MNLKRSLELIEKYGKCEQCGNENISNGEGTLNIDGDVFERTCKCGWKVTVRPATEEEKKRAEEMKVIFADTPKGGLMEPWKAT
ncbi:DUF3797 domain-containing protein [Paenibacillus polymyxa]|uniref:DUF3797 domain-containing protein n=1 Tax=Paenibacillus polymyxa TaxID=1406 RepID=UPI00129AB59A|nr:DUF3797 domain-containing protein [Paenibacillus polymyxa]KAE8559114.1 hypothetical protein BJH92_16000 [Paenibacillus polymyxa]MCJ1222262.1 DUF3797 domain-containing protein [Paenibacillus polymyxa]